MFLSEQATKFGDWVKAGALKAGDRLSTSSSINALKRLGIAADLPAQFQAANDNTVTITAILQSHEPIRVYNMEIESRAGEVTHNYLVGGSEIWNHNAGIGRNDPRPTFLYKLYDQAGKFLKWGITINPLRRYPKNKCYILKVQKCGCRSDMLDEERQHVMNNPGPMNRESWAGRGVGK
ncbi:hypothetical protein ACFQ14_14705 [Pseudahrensia aquimaris]|uniref:Intein C-terminal splicing domain-containing protein n=1 Tax=Pseudahrensia aquimaris TaxID=744461 RepID=A0ABW3FLP2_9HYPH